MSNSHTTQSPTTTATNAKSAASSGVNVCGPCVKSFEIANEKADKKERDRTGPKSWLERKVCGPMLRSDDVSLIGYYSLQLEWLSAYLDGVVMYSGV